LEKRRDGTAIYPRDLKSGKKTTLGRKGVGGLCKKSKKRGNYGEQKNYWKGWLWTRGLSKNKKVWRG